MASSVNRKHLPPLPYRIRTRTAGEKIAKTVPDPVGFLLL